MCDEIYALRYELNEANSELERHHRDFKKISEIVENTIGDINYLQKYDVVLYLNNALNKIRNIVG